MIIAVLFVLGLVFGSFTCASVWRWHEQSQLAVKKRLTASDEAYKKDLSIIKGRSMCGHCRHELAAKDLVPLLSWLWLRGKCRYCRQSIGWLEPSTEVAMAASFVASYIWWPQVFTGQGLFDFIVWLVLVCGFVALSIIDLKWFLLPDKIVAGLTAVTVVKLIVDIVLFGGGWAVLAGAAEGALVIGGLFYLLFAFSKGTWIGGGDVKIAAMLGILAGSPLKALMLIFLASLLGLLAAVPLLVHGKANRSSHIPFGPFLLVATGIVVLFGDKMVAAYRVLFALN